MATQLRPLAIVTGASSGIGFELAKCCAQNGFDLLIAADEDAIENAAATLRVSEVSVEAVQARSALRCRAEHIAPLYMPKGTTGTTTT